MPKKKKTNDTQKTDSDRITPGGLYNPGREQKKQEAEEQRKKETTLRSEPLLKPEEKKVYRKALRVLNQTDITYAVGAAFARFAYTGIWRPTKDLDVFLKKDDLKTALDALDEAGFRCEILSKHWLAKAYLGEYFIDLIFGTGHGQMPVDDETFFGSQPAGILGVKSRLISLEELIASAAYIAERRRFDGGEIVHLIKHTEGEIDWERLLERMGVFRELLLWHLLLFDFVYPTHSDYLPKELMVQLFAEMQSRWEKPVENQKEFRGTLLDPFSYIVDIKEWGYEDPRNLESLVNASGEPV